MESIPVVEEVLAAHQTYFLEHVGTMEVEIDDRGRRRQRRAEPGAMMRRGNGKERVKAYIGRSWEVATFATENEFLKCLGNAHFDQFRPL